MPLYEYKCKDCGTISEFLNKEEKLVCSSCGGFNLEKQFSDFSVVNKGSEHKERSCCGRTEPCNSQKRCCSH
jgi:putative FmdB family regulatory protein